MCEVLKKDKNLKLQNNKKLCIFEDKNEKFEIQIGAWDTEISEIYVAQKALELAEREFNKENKNFILI